MHTYRFFRKLLTVRQALVTLCRVHTYLSKQTECNKNLFIIPTLFSKLKMYLLITLFSATNAQSWLRRAYFDDTKCAGILSVGVSVPATYPCAQTTPLISACEVKGQDPAKTGLLKSAEISGCMKRDGAVTDAVWVPTANEGKLAPGATYLTVNAYTDQGCAPTALSEQNMFLADGKCYAVEFETSFFKASCQGDSGTLTVCTDSLCQNCNSQSTLAAGIYQVKSVAGDGTCTVPTGGLAYKVVCSVPGGNGGTDGSSAPTNGGNNGNSGNGNSNSEQQKVASLLGMTGLVAAIMT